MSAEFEIQKAVCALLRADATLSALIAAHSTELATSAVYEGAAPQVPKSEEAARFPYVVVGESTWIDNDTDDSIGDEVTLTLHQFVRAGGNKRVREIQGRIKALMHRNTAIVVAGRVLVDCLQEYAEVMPDPDGVTRHGVSRFRFTTEGG